MGGAEIIDKIVDDLKDDNEAYWKLVMETIEKICSQLGVADINQKLEQWLIDGILNAFSYGKSDD